MTLLLSASFPFRLGLAAGSAALVVLVVTPLVLRVARWGGWVDVPMTGRWHVEATPHLGGIGIILGILVGGSVGGGETALPPLVWGGAGLLFGVGLVDDLWGLGARSKLIGQIVPVGLLLGSGLLLWDNGPFWGALPLTAVWVLGITNALNLLDAMDGISAGVAAFAAVGFGMVGLVLGRPELAVAASVVASAAGAFLVYNFKPAQLFMGDCGSLPLGYLLAGLGISVEGGEGVSVVVPLLGLAVPLADTAFVVVTRLRRGQSVAQGGTDHTMHRLVRLGWSERQVALLFYGAAAATGGAGLLALIGPAPLGWGLVLAVGGAAITFGRRLERTTDAGPAPAGPSHDEGAPSEPPPS